MENVGNEKHEKLFKDAPWGHSGRHEKLNI